MGGPAAPHQARGPWWGFYLAASDVLLGTKGLIMASGTRESRPARIARRSNVTNAITPRPVMSELQLAAYLAARDAVRRASRFSRLLPSDFRGQLSSDDGRRAGR